MKIYLAADHAGFELKEEIKKHLQDKSQDVEDCGNLNYDVDDDYPDFIVLAAQKVSEDPGSFGIVVGKSGNGEAIVANKIKGIRCAFGFNDESVKLSRLHNNANMLSLGSSFVELDYAKKLVDLFLETQFSNEERHTRRLEKIKSLENA